MTKNNIVFSVIMGVAITLLLTSTNPAQADPTGDTVFINIDGIPVGPEQTVIAVVGPGPEAFFNQFDIPEFPLTVDIDDGTVWIDMPNGVFAPLPFTIHIEDIDWIDDGVEVQGGIIEVLCEAFIFGTPFGPVPVDWDTDEDGSTIWIFVDPIFLQGLPSSIHCEYSVVHIVPRIVLVDIDIKPGSFPNSINPRSMGLVPVAILGSDFLNVFDVDVTTLSFGPGGAAPVHLEDGAVSDEHYEDVNDDGFIDLVTHYVQKEALPAAPEACLTGALDNGTLIEGCDSVRTPGNK